MQRWRLKSSNMGLSTNSVLSISAPYRAEDQVPAKKQWKDWSKYFMRRCGGGGSRSSYQDAQSANPDVTFQRLCPRSEEASDFEIDSHDMGRMVEAVRLRI